MEGEARRAKLLSILSVELQAISGTELASRLGVSRQVIVQDIALLRAVNKNILSTNKGYLLYQDTKETLKKKRTFKVKHENSEIEDELYTIVDHGGKVLDVVVAHEIYGQITVDLIINNRVDADTFVKNIKKYGTKPLNDLTNGVHFHTIEADCDEALMRIETALGKKGYLMEEC